MALLHLKLHQIWDGLKKIAFVADKREITRNGIEVNGTIQDIIDECQYVL